MCLFNTACVYCQTFHAPPMCECMYVLQNFMHLQRQRMNVCIAKHFTRLRNMNACSSVHCVWISQWIWLLQSLATFFSGFLSVCTCVSIHDSDWYNMNSIVLSQELKLVSTIVILVLLDFQIFILCYSELFHVHLQLCRTWVKCLFLALLWLFISPYIAK